MSPQRALLVSLVFATAMLSAIASTPWGREHAISSPSAVLRALVDDLSRAALARDIAATALRAALSSSIALLLGALVGLAFGPPRSPLRPFVPVLHSVRSVPPVLVYPLLLLALGHNERSRIAAAALGSFALVALPVASSIERIAPERLDIARLARLTLSQRVALLYVPEALPATLVALRLAFSQCLVVSIVTEMLAAPQRGLGVVAVSALQEYRADRLWLVIALSASLNALASVFIALIERAVFDRAKSPREK